MKKKLLLISLAAFVATGVTTFAIVHSEKGQSLAKASDGVYWYHYAQVTPTYDTHGSKEFWANCSTHNFTLEHPGFAEDIREGDPFDSTPYFAELTSDDERYLPPLSEKVNIKGYLESLLQALNHDPYSFVPDTMRPEGVTKYQESDFDYHFDEGFTDVNEIKYGGFGEQWHMVIENIKESQRFYNITTYGSEVIGASYLLISAFLDDYYDNTITKTFAEEGVYTSKIDFNGSILSYNIQFKSGIEVPLFGEIVPQLDMEYVIASSTKTVRIQLAENNALKFVITPDTYTFGLEYGIEEVSRKAYFALSKDESDDVEGHIYEFVQYKEKDLVSSCADFYIGETYTSVVGNKANALPGFTGIINELYKTDEGKLLGYEVKEKSIIGGVVTYNTLWFNLDEISGIDSVKSIPNGLPVGAIGAGNPYDVYVNSSSDIFATKEFGGLNVLKMASRRFDIEQRYQYFYSVEDGKIVEYETSIPMMFIQEEKLGEFASNVRSVNSYLDVALNVPSTNLTKIQDDYDTLIKIFEDNKEDDIGSADIVEFIGDPVLL